MFWSQDKVSPVVRWGSWGSPREELQWRGSENNPRRLLATPPLGGSWSGSKGNASVRSQARVPFSCSDEELSVWSLTIGFCRNRTSGILFRGASQTAGHVQMLMISVASALAKQSPGDANSAAQHSLSLNCCYSPAISTYTTHFPALTVDPSTHPLPLATCFSDSCTSNPYFLLPPPPHSAWSIKSQVHKCLFWHKKPSCITQSKPQDTTLTAEILLTHSQAMMVLLGLFLSPQNTRMG